MGVALGGAAGARLSRSTGLATSRNTLLRLVRRAPLPPDATPAALDVDDWALCKRLAYRRVSASVLASFSYAQILSSTGMGLLVFGAIPDRWTFAGATIVMGIVWLT